MASNYQYPYVKIIRANGEVIPNADHNKQEIQLECVTDALGNYDFAEGSITERLGTIETNFELDDISDVDASSPTVGDVLIYTDPGWETIALPVDLNGLEDVVINLPADGQTLVYKGASGTWQNEDRGLTIASGLPGSPEEVNSATPITEIRFITQTAQGADHYVTEVADGVAYIGGGTPPVVLSGALTGLVGLVTGKMSQSNINYPPATSAGDTYASITQTGAVTLAHAVGQFGFASLGNLILAVNGVDVANIDLGANFLEGSRDAGQNIPGTYNVQGTGSVVAGGVVSFGVGSTLTLLTVAPTSITTDAFQQGTTQIGLVAADLRQGHNSAVLRHETGSGTNTTSTLNWFYDIDPAGATDPAVTATDLTEDTPVLKELSGISYYDTGSTFDLDVTLVRGFDNAYHQSDAPLELSSGWAGSTTIPYTDGSVGGVSTPPDIGEIMAVTSFGLTTAAGVQDNDAQAIITPRDPYGSYTPAVSTSKNFAIMSDGPNSTDVFDDFTDERYRLPSSTNFDVLIAGMPGAPLLWNSATSLLDGSRTGELQVYDFEEASGQNRLRWPSFDHSNGTNFQPQPNPDYSSLGGTDRVYRRVFRSIISQSNGVLTLPGLTDANIVSDVGIRVKVPGRTVWLDVTVSFNGATFPSGAPLVGGVDDEGCRINPGVNSPDLNGSLEFSLGTIGTDVSSDFQVIVEITYANSSVAELIGTGSGLSINW
tara:strand:+ start:51892 stop:54033 length:2142 start_codon:yes stop_codon:yes gene_type:complete